MKIMFAGDIHGNTQHLEWVLSEGRDQRVDRIIAVGDFGYLPATTAGDQFLRDADRLADHYAIPIWWLDGNDDDHSAISARVYATDAAAPVVTGAGPVSHLPRGCVVDVDGLRLMAYGGAWSMDWMDRTEGVDWWPEETIDFDHMEMAADRAGKVDLLVTHECPAGNPIGAWGDHPMAAAQRLYIGHLMDRVTPRLVVSGHHHQFARWDDPVTGCPVVVLGRDGQGPASVLLVDTDDLMSP